MGERTVAVGARAIHTIMRMNPCEQYSAERSRIYDHPFGGRIICIASRNCYRDGQVVLRLCLEGPR